MNAPLPVRSARHAEAIAFLVLVTLALAVGACNQSATPGPSALPSGPTGSAPSSIGPTSATITSPEAAAAAVIGSDPRFAGLTPQDPNVIGQCCFYSVKSAADGYVVTIEVGWGDCQAGCIDRHHWTYAVKTDGTIHLDREDGPPVPAGVPGSSGGTPGGMIGIRGIASAGPVCPVVRPNDSNCADRPVQGATVHIIDATGTEVATLETDAAGAFVVTLPPGRYRVVPDPVPGLMRNASPVDATVTSGLVQVQLTYDTGIR
jgi:hypothetical protein